jgi:hypothetical protein
MPDRYKIRKYDSAAGKEQYEIFKATIRLIIRQVTARIKGTIIDLSNQSKKQIRIRPLEGATHAVRQLSKAAAADSEMRRVIQRAADNEVTGCKSSLSNLVVVVVVIEHSRQQLENRK